MFSIPFRPFQRAYEVTVGCVVAIAGQRRSVMMQKPNDFLFSIRHHDLNEEEREYLKVFKKFSREVHGKIRRFKEPSYEREREYDEGIDIIGKGFGLRLCLKPSLGMELFKLSFEKEEPIRPYALSLLIEFKRGVKHPDAIKCVLRDLDDWTYLVREYAFEYLRGEAKDFDQFEAYVKARFEPMMTDWSYLKANKWFRPEW